MFDALKKKSLKSSLFLTILLALIGGGMMIGFATGAWYVVTGYVSFVDLEPDEISNQWVALELKENWGAFAETTEKRQGSLEKTLNVYYIILTGDDYATDFRYMAVSVPASYEKKMESMKEYGAYDNPLFLSGRIRKMGDDIYGWFKEYLMAGGFTEEDLEQYTLPYYIQVYANEPMENACTLGAFLVGLLLVVIAVVRLLKAMNGSFLKKLKEDIASINVSETSAESDWNSAREICKDVKIGRLFTYYMEGSKPRAIPNTKILWAYQNTTTHRTNGIKTGTTYSVMIWVDGWKNAATIGMPNEATAQEMLKYFAAQFPWVVLGYSDELRKMYKNNLGQFMQLRYNTVDHNAVMYGFENIPS
ncbi:MAG: hypothetical protein NC420_02430 [Eubacterium sp.]|nr:hypothetical protein [Eubacterium sp.]MCM1216648.1 hypothetical protein [Lachnospiraceae bacterium]MCM1303122.1 hypothetical protein [Butyrivibrio sp.]MCM1342791.1 hypothetical protein [Muribaculaceae bacterium]MCM1240427.1 hypothetical protein [Lachnospiraceae bacterium]